MISASRRSSGSCWTPRRIRAEVVAVLHQRLGRVRRRQIAPASSIVASAAGASGRGSSSPPGCGRCGSATAAAAGPCDSSLRALEVPVGLQERLLGQVLGVVVVAHPVVRVRVDVAQVRPVELAEVGVELAPCRRAAAAIAARSLPRGYAALRLRGPACGAGAARSATRSSASGSTRPSMMPGQPVEHGRVDARVAAARSASSGTAADRLGGLAERGADLVGRHALRPAARRRGGCASPRPARWRRGRPRRPGRRTSPGASRSARASASISANTLPAAAPAAFGPAAPAAAAASAAAFLAQPASSTPTTSLRVRDVEAGGGERVARPGGAKAAVVAASDERGAVARAPRRRAPGRRARRSPRRACARRRRRAGSVPSGGTRPLESTSTPVRGAIAAPCAATAAGSSAAGTAKATRSWRRELEVGGAHRRARARAARRRAGSAR